MPQIGFHVCKIFDKLQSLVNTQGFVWKFFMYYIYIFIHLMFPMSNSNLRVPETGPHVYAKYLG